MSNCAECGLRIDGATLKTNDKGELTVVGGGGDDKSQQISLYDSEGNIAAQLTIEAEGGKASLHFSGTNTNVPIILSGVDTPAFDGDAVNKKYFDDKAMAKFYVEQEASFVSIAGKTYDDEDITGDNISIATTEKAGVMSAADKVALDSKPGKTVSTTFAEIFNDYEKNKATQAYAHAEGTKSVANGYASHVEGQGCKTTGEEAHAEGRNSTASGDYSHAEGNYATASGLTTHAEGSYTIAAGNYSHVQGKYNIQDTESKYAHIVGNGTSSARSNAHTLDWQGNAWFAGNVTNAAGKGLSEEDFTVELKAKLEGIVELPVVTETDNGKILKVVNGAWAVADA